jgi:hypothetical protein
LPSLLRFFSFFLSFPLSSGRVSFSFGTILTHVVTKGFSQHLLSHHFCNRLSGSQQERKKEAETRNEKALSSHQLYATPRTPLQASPPFTNLYDPPLLKLPLRSPPPQQQPLSPPPSSSSSPRTVASLQVSDVDRLSDRRLSVHSWKWQRAPGESLRKEAEVKKEEERRRDGEGCRCSLKVR